MVKSIDNKRIGFLRRQANIRWQEFLLQRAGYLHGDPAWEVWSVYLSNLKDSELLQELEVFREAFEQVYLQGSLPEYLRDPPKNDYLLHRQLNQIDPKRLYEIFGSEAKERGGWTEIQTRATEQKEENEVSRLENIMMNIMMIIWPMIIIGLIVYGIYDWNKCDPNETCAPKREIMEVMATVCEGLGNPEASEYRLGDSGIHPIVVLNSDGEPDSLSDDIIRKWHPESIQETEIVACIENETYKKVKQCGPYGPRVSLIESDYYVDLFQANEVVTLRKAKSGEEVASKEFSEISSCPEQIKDGTKEYRSDVPSSDIVDWLRNYVE